MRMFRVAGLLLLSLLLVGASGRAAGDAPTSEEGETIAALGPDGVQRVEMLAGSYFFKPRHVVVKVGVPVELKVSKEAGMTPHDIVVKAPEAGVSFAVDLTAEPRTISFTPGKVGKYPIYCDKGFLFFANHREKGMEGVLEVRE